MLRSLTLLLLSTCTVFAGSLSKTHSDGTPVRVEPAGFFLTFPIDWNLLRPLPPDEYPPNVCFPRFDGPDGHVDSVLIRPKPPTLQDAVTHYIERETARERSNERIAEVERAPFASRSGISGIRVALDRQTSSGRIRLHRYFFQLPNGEFVCLGTFGSPALHDIILDTLRME